MSFRVICGGDVDASPATLDPARGLIHDAAPACDGLGTAALAVAVISRRRDAVLGGELNTSSSIKVAMSLARSESPCVAMLPQLLC